mgnify:FL=1
MQVWDGKIVLDEHGIAGQLKAKVLREFDRESLSAWIDYLKSMVNIRPDGTLTR